MAQARLTNAIPKHVERNASAAARRAARATFEGVAFESLTPIQKDAALKELLIRAGLIPES
jgi:hypothetical protein